MTPRFHFTRHGLLVLAAITIAGCSSDRTTAPNARATQLHGPSAALVDLTSTPALYNQTSTSDQTESVTWIGDTTYYADDFVVPEGAEWTITTVGVTGNLRKDLLPFSIRTDADGAPGARVPNAVHSLAPTASEGSDHGTNNYVFSLPTAVTLPAGRYWLMIEAGTPTGGNTFFWQTRFMSNLTAVMSLYHGESWEALGRDFTFGVFGTAVYTQTITLATVTPNPAPIGSTATLNVTATSGLTVALAASPSSVCTLTGTTLSFVGLGTCKVTANQAGNTTYLPAPQVTQDIAVVLAAQTITFPAVTPNPATVSSSTTLAATASSGLPVTFSALTKAVCTVTGNTLSYVAAGICIVAADQFGNASYDVASTQTQNVDVVKMGQTLSFTSAAPAPAYINGTYAVSASGGASGQPVVITAGTPNVCTVTANVVRFVGVGTCTVTANQAGNAVYNAAAPASQTVHVAYRFDGFLGAVNNGDVLNTAKAGQTIALAWRLTDANGAPITTLAVARITAVDLSCALGVTTDQLAEQAAGGSGLQNLGDGYYQYNWKAPGSYARSCKTLQLDLGEGTGARIARFAFVK